MSKEKTFIQFDREVITQLNDTTEAIVLGYIIHEQISSIREHNTLRKITRKEIASKFQISEKQVGRVKNKLESKNLLVKDSPVPNPRIGELVWDDDYKYFKEATESTERVIWHLTAIDETTDYFEHGFIKVDKEWFENPKINITTKYWTIFFKAFEPTKTWTPTYSGIVEKSCWEIDTIKKNYYKLRDEGWIHNDNIYEIPNGWDTIKAKSYNIDFEKEINLSDEEVKKEVKELTKDSSLMEEQIAEKVDIFESKSTKEDIEDIFKRAVINSNAKNKRKQEQSFVLYM